jgi:hypothetical protein
MKISPLLPAVLALALLPAACAKEDRFTAIASVVEQQNKTIIDQQQILLDQQQKLINQEMALNALTSQLASDEEAWRKIQEQVAIAPAPEAAPAPSSKVDTHKVAVVRDLTGFSGRLSANIGYQAYADSLSDLNANLAQAMLDIKDQGFIDEVNRIRSLYNSAGEFWERFSSQGLAEISLTQTDRYKYADLGVNFVDSYNLRPTDVKKFWLCASDEIQKLLDYNSTDLGRDGVTVVRLFGR